MADTTAFFENFLPKKIASKPELQGSIKNSIVFDITGAGIWTLDLRTAPGAVVAGAVENAGCTITVAKADWEKLLDNPAAGMQLFMMGKLKVKGSTGLAMQLQKILA
jgi:putative sterol carrier protein